MPLTTPTFRPTACPRPRPAICTLIALFATIALTLTLTITHLTHRPPLTALAQPLQCNTFADNLAQPYTFCYNIVNAASPLLNATLCGNVTRGYLAFGFRASSTTGMNGSSVIVGWLDSTNSTNNTVLLNADLGYHLILNNNSNTLEATDLQVYSTFANDSSANSSGTVTGMCIAFKRPLTLSSAAIRPELTLVPSNATYNSTMNVLFSRGALPAAPSPSLLRHHTSRLATTLPFIDPSASSSSAASPSTTPLPQPETPLQCSNLIDNLAQPYVLCMNVVNASTASPLLNVSLCANVSRGWIAFGWRQTSSSGMLGASVMLGWMDSLNSTTASTNNNTFVGNFDLGFHYVLATNSSSLEATDVSIASMNNATSTCLAFKRPLTLTRGSSPHVEYNIVLNSTMNVLFARGALPAAPNATLVRRHTSRIPTTVPVYDLRWPSAAAPSSSSSSAAVAPSSSTDPSATTGASLSSSSSAVPSNNSGAGTSITNGVGSSSSSVAPSTPLASSSTGGAATPRYSGCTVIDGDFTLCVDSVGADWSSLNVSFCGAVGGGWLGIAFQSPSVGVRMNGASGIIGWSDGAGSSDIAMYDLIDYFPQPAVTLRATNLGVTFDGNTSITCLSFVRPLAVPLNPALTIGADGVLNVMFAHGDRPSDASSLEHHRSRGALAITLGRLVERAESLEANPGAIDWKAVHASLMMLSFGCLFPAAALCPILLRSIGPLWFDMHRALITAALMVAIAGFGIAVHQFEPTYAKVAPPAHRLIGMVCMAFACFQPVNAVLRPHPPSVPGEQPSRRRRVWSVLHRLCGYSVLTLGFTNIAVGVNTFALSRWWCTLPLTVVWPVVAVGMLVCVFVVAPRLRARKACGTVVATAAAGGMMTTMAATGKSMLNRRYSMPTGGEKGRAYRSDSGSTSVVTSRLSVVRPAGCDGFVYSAQVQAFVPPQPSSARGASGGGGGKGASPQHKRGRSGSVSSIAIELSGVDSALSRTLRGSTSSNDLRGSVGGGGAASVTVAPVSASSAAAAVVVALHTRSSRVMSRRQQSQSQAAAAAAAAGASAPSDADLGTRASEC